MTKLMLVEDDSELANVVHDYLVEHGYDVSVEKTGDKAASRILQEKPDAVILDVNLPELDGFSVCRQIRDSYPGAIIMLTARSGDIDEVLGLELGADDYLAKPVRPTVLLARLKSHLKKSPAKANVEEVLEVGSLKICSKRRSVELSGKPVELKPAEFELLLILARTAGKIVTRPELFKQINPGETYDFADRSIDVRVSRLRKKLGDNAHQPKLIVSIRGNGYVLVVPS